MTCHTIKKMICLFIMKNISDIIQSIKDPEKPATLADLEVVYEEGCFVQQLENQQCHVTVYFKLVKIIKTKRVDMNLNSFQITN